MKGLRDNDNQRSMKDLPACGVHVLHAANWTTLSRQPDPRTRIEINCAPSLDKENLLALLVEKLKLPSYCAANWDAIHECLCEINVETLIIFHSFASLNYQTRKSLRAVFCNASEVNPKLCAILLPDEPTPP